MEAMRIHHLRVGDPAPFTDADKSVRQIKPGSAIDVVALEAGTASGCYSIAIRAELEDGSIAILQTTAALFLGAASAIRGCIEGPGGGS